MATCIICNKELTSNNPLKKYCSRKCFDRKNYLLHKEKIIARVVKYTKNNMEKKKIWAHTAYLKLKKTNYYNSYYKSRWKTDDTFRQKKNIRNIHNKNRKNIIKDFCAICGEKNNLQIHHLKYEKEITVEAVQTLCKSCHIKIHTGKMVT